jgi:CxxC-x17-CxxC domain-containing protein
MNQGRKNNRGAVGNRRNFNNQRNSNFRGSNFSSGPREMHKAVCSKCGNNCEVPFKPAEGKPVFC